MDAFAIKGPDGTIQAAFVCASAYKAELLFFQTFPEYDAKIEVVPVQITELPVCEKCGGTDFADFYRGSSVVAKVCKKCDHKQPLPPPPKEGK